MSQPWDVELPFDTEPPDRIACPGGCGDEIYTSELPCCGKPLCQAGVFPEAFDPVVRFIPEGWTEE